MILITLDIDWASDFTIKKVDEILKEKNIKASLRNSTFKKPLHSELKKKLTFLQYRVTQENGTEPPYFNSYWNNNKQGIYVDIVSGEPLFSSKDKQGARSNQRR